MKTTLDIPENTLNELLKSGNFRSKKEAVNTAIETYLQNKRIESLLQAAGSMETFLTRGELTAFRKND